MRDVLSLLEATFPIQSRSFSLEWVPDPQALATLAPEADLYVLLRLISWSDEEEGQRLISGVKEQPVLLVPAHYRQDPRVPAWLEGLREALLTVMRSQEPWLGGDNPPPPPKGFTPIDYTLPFDLVPCDVLKLARPRTAEDFTQALLRSTRRVGHLLFPPREPPAPG